MFLESTNTMFHEIHKMFSEVIEKKVQSNFLEVGLSKKDSIHIPFGIKPPTVCELHE